MDETSQAQFSNHGKAGRSWVDELGSVTFPLAWLLSAEMHIMTSSLVGLVMFLAVYNNVVALRRLPGWTYVPLNLAVAALVATVAWAQGLSWSEMGLDAHGLSSGLRWGIALAAVIAAGLAVATIVPRVHVLFHDERVAGLGPSGVAYMVGVRIPFGTVLLEEVAFRGVLYGAWDRVASPLEAAIGSSVVFGLWHIAPSLDLWRENQLGRDRRAMVLFVGGSVVVTAAGGLLLVWLRVRTGGIYGPAIVHAAANAFATLAAVIHQRSTRSS